EADVSAAAEALRQRFDAEHAGFGFAPKFPTPHHALFLLRRAAVTGETDLTGMAVATLRAIRRGGVFDHVGGGLHRYSTDRTWLLPHFEKMLYDQALYSLACAEGHLATGAPDLREAAESTLDYVLRDLRSPAGGLYSAEDADSLDADGHREEGAFYVWTPRELADVLGPEDATLAAAVWGATREGNYLDEATRQRTGANVLHLPAPDLAEADPLATAAQRLDLDVSDARDRLASIRQRLLETREQRPRPLLDDKVLTDWNGLAVAALAVAGRVFGRSDYAEAARQAVAFLLGTMRTEDGLLHRYREGKAAIPGLLDDYAFLVWGLVELYQTEFDEAHLEAALRLHGQMRERFENPEGGYFLSPEDAPDLIVRQRALDDGALPAGNSVAVLNGLRLAALTGDSDLTDAAYRGLRVPETVRKHPSGFTHLMAAAAFAHGPSQEIVLAGERGASDTHALLAAVRSVYAPHAVVALRTPGTGEARLALLAPFTAAQESQDGRATAYVCRDHACETPTTNSDAARAALAASVGRVP
ncbi:MAG: thioredoxin domain-containing protein, partial [Bacteroidota bacterium]